MTRPLFEPLENRQLFAVPLTLSITSVTTSTPTVPTDKSFNATVTVKNASPLDPANVVFADVFLVPQGKSLDPKTDFTTTFGFTPITAGISRSLSQSTPAKKIAPGVYTLTACLLDPDTKVPDTSKPVTGPTITIVTLQPSTSPPPMSSTPTTFTAGTTFLPTLSITNTTKTAITTKIPVTYYLSKDATWSGKDITLLRTSFNNLTLPPSKTTPVKRTLTIPKNLKGEYFLIAVINPTNSNPALPHKVIATAPTPFTITNQPRSSSDFCLPTSLQG